MEVIFTLQQIEETAGQLLSISLGYKVFAMHGELGSGKTTLIHALCKTMGVIDNVSSPTFSIINQYKTADGESVFHIDLYRIKNMEEAISTGVEDCLYSGDHCFVEWPERAPGIFPGNTVHLYIDTIDTNTRKLQVDLSES